jgi:hypothetical protein
MAFFTRHTNVCVRDRKIDCSRTMTLRIEFEAKDTPGFVYGPSYVELSGYSEVDCAFR